MAILTSGSFYANAVEIRYIGLECTKKFDSQPGTSVKDGNDKIYLICFESTNYPEMFVWSKDNNKYPATTYPEYTIAYGRDPEVCEEDATNAELVVDYGRTFCDT